MAPYTDAAAIAAYLGVTLTPEQAAQADVVARAVTTGIDRRTGRTWQTATPVSGELDPVIGLSVYLQHAPVVSVSSVETRPPGSLGPWTTISAADYELTDAAYGVVTLPYGYANGQARVDYAHGATAPPDDLAYAATVIAADLLGPTLRPGTAGAESISVGQNDVTVKLAGAAGQTSAELRSALDVVDGYRRWVIAS